MNPLLRWAGRLVAITVGFVLLLQLYFFVAVGLYTRIDPTSTSFMKSHRRPDAAIEHRWVPYARISDHLKRAVITAEDARFADHEGVDWEAIGKAYENNEKIAAATAAGKRPPSKIKGGSTITQQLAKNLFLSGERSYLRKGQELVIAYMLEFWMSKRRILEIYLNVVEWGDGVFGAEAAALHYFKVSAAQLTPGQAARLAVMLPNPRYYDARRGSAYLARRSAAIARWMGDADLP